MRGLLEAARGAARSRSERSSKSLCSANTSRSSASVMAARTRAGPRRAPERRHRRRRGSGRARRSRRAGAPPRRSAGRRASIGLALRDELARQRAVAVERPAPAAAAADLRCELEGRPRRRRAISACSAAAACGDELPERSLQAGPNAWCANFAPPAVAPAGAARHLQLPVGPPGAAQAATRACPRRRSAHSAPSHSSP